MKNTFKLLFNGINVCYELYFEYFKSRGHYGYFYNRFLHVMVNGKEFEKCPKHVEPASI